jgi:broad specificity phosphatase PhoE
VRIILLRHGRTVVNAEGRLQGRVDAPLDDHGTAQAEALARAVPVLADDVVRIVSSPLQRCRQTAAAVASPLGIDVDVDERWVEMDYGDLDGTPLADVPADVWRRWQADLAWRPVGGESVAEVGERVRAACDDLTSGSTSREGAGPPEGAIVVVSHVSPIKAAVAWALGVGDEVCWRMFMAPASITRIAFRQGRPQLTAFNETHHLMHPTDRATGTSSPW